MSFTRIHRYPSVKKRYAMWAALFSVGALAMPATVLASNETESFTTDSEHYFKSEDIFNLEYVSEVQVSPRLTFLMKKVNHNCMCVGWIQGKRHSLRMSPQVLATSHGHQTVSILPLP